MHEQGIQLNLSQLKPENLEDLVDQLSDLTVDVDEEHTKVLIRRCCLIHLKKSSTCQRRRYSSAITPAGRVKLLVRKISRFSCWASK